MALKRHMWRELLALLCLPCILSEHLQLPAGSECSWQGVKGLCVGVHRCFGAIEDIKEGNHPPICTYEETTPVICCTDCELVEDTRLMLVNPQIGLLTLTGTNKAKDKCLQYIHTLGYPCKRGVLTHIEKRLDEEKNCYKFETRQFRQIAAGGRDADRDEYPHMALLGYGTSVDTADWLCGGSVISERFILTAAHCSSTPALGPVKYVAVGILKRSDPDEVWQRHEVKRFIAHPQYQSPSKYHDIALIETDQEMTFSGKVLPACLHVDEKVDVVAEATGWGALGHKQALADILQSVQVSKYSSAECSERYPPHRHLKHGFNDSTQMCYGDRGDEPRDTCQGDSGGPLQSRSHEACAHTVLGVTSYGRACGHGRSSGVYTRVAHYVPWIQELVWPGRDTSSNITRLGASVTA